jgi:hypothetical protein
MSVLFPQTEEHIAGKAAYARFRWTTDDGAVPYIANVRRYAYALYFFAAAAILVWSIHRQYLGLRAAGGVALAVGLAPVALPVIQWGMFKIGLLAMGVLGGHVSPHMREKYQWGLEQ